MADAKIVISAKDDASRVLGRVEGSLNTVGSVATRVGSAIGLAGAVSVAGFVAMAKAAIDGVDALNDVRDATGASIENISALEDVAARTGTEMATVTTALVKFNAVLKEADAGSKAEATLKAIGLSAKELKALDPAEALLKTATALSTFADDGNKARITQELFGKSLKDVAPLLKDLAEQGKLVATVTTQQAEEAEKFNKELFAMKKNAVDLGRSIASDLLPTLNDLAVELNAAKKTASGFFDGFITMGTQNPFKSTVENLAAVREELQGLETDRKRLAQGGNDTSAIDASIATIKRRLEYFKEVRLQQIKFDKDDQSSAESARLRLLKKSVGDVPDADKKDKKAVKTQAQKDAEELQKERIRLGRQAVIDEAELREKRNEAEAKALQDAEKDRAKYYDTLAKELAAQQTLNEKMREQVGEIGLTTEGLNALRLARQDDAIAQEEATLAQARAHEASAEELVLMQKRIDLLKETRTLTAQGQIKQAAADTEKEQKDASKAFAKELNGDLKGAFSAAFRDTSGDPLQAFGDALSNVVYTRIATAAAESLASSFSSSSFGSDSGGGGSAGGLSALFSAFMSFDGGGYTGSGARAGGLDGKGGFLAVMHPQETVTDHTKGQSTNGAPVTVVQNFTVGDVASVSMVRAAVAGSERRIAGAMARSRTYGGALS